MAIIRVQQTSAQGTGGATASATFGATSTAGNLLIALLAFQGGSIVGPTGFTQAVNNTSVNGAATYLYYRENAPATNTLTFAFAPSPHWTIFIAEYSGIVTSSSLDQTNSSTTTSTPATSGSVTTTANDEVVIVGMGNKTANVYSSLTNSFNLLDQRQVSPDVSGGFFDRIVTSTGTYDTAATVSGGANAVIASFIGVSPPAPNVNNAIWLGQVF